MKMVATSTSRIQPKINKIINLMCDLICDELEKPKTDLNYIALSQMIEALAKLLK